MKKLISLLSIFALVASIVAISPVANAQVAAGAVTGNTAADRVAGTVGADYNVTFTTNTAIASTAITVTFPATYTITTGALTAAAVQSGVLGTSGNITLAGTGDVAVASVAGDNAGKTIILTIGATDLSTGAVSFRILTGVTNPTALGVTGTFTIATNGVGDAPQAGIAGVVITAAALTGVVDTPSSLAAGATSTHSVVFTTAVTNTAIASIDITFQVGFNIAGAAIGTYVVTDAAATPVVSFPGGQVVRVTFGTPSTGTLATTFTINLTGIVNIVTSGNATVTVTTNDAGVAPINGPTVSGNFLIAPATINLSCVSSGSAGAIYLRWATPLSATGAYTAKYSLANILTNDADATFNAATTFAQNPAWATGTVGDAQQQLVTALTPNNTYFFNLKVLGNNASLSAASNTVFCTAPSSYVTASDTTAPTSIIVSPTVSQGIKAGTNFTVSGTASDTGGSSVQKVEVSLDGGTTWNIAEAVSSTAGVLSWQYVWSNPVVGSYTVKARAYDWLGNRETPGAGVAVTVATTLPSFTVEIVAPATITTTPAAAATISAMPYASPVGATQITANITYLQGQLLTLLQQLVALLQTQLQTLGH
jgi:hypothetical protein